MENIKNFWRNRYKYFAWCFFEAALGVLVGFCGTILLCTHDLLWVLTVLGIVGIVWLLAGAIWECHNDN